MTWLQLVRLITLCFTLACGIIVLSLASHVTSLSEKYYAIYYAFEALGIAVGALTMLTIPVMIAIDFLRTGAFTSMVVVELSWLSVLWVLWLATAAQTADQTSTAFANCDFGYAILDQVCNETHAIEAFSFLAWIVLMAYTILLLVVALINGTRGAPMWTSSVKQMPSIVPAPLAGASTQMGTVPQHQQQQQPVAGQYHGQQQQQQQQAYAPVPTASPPSTVAYSTTAAPPAHSPYPQV